MCRMGAVAGLALPDALAPERRSRAALAATVAAAGGVACALSIAAPAFHHVPVNVLDQSIHAGVAAAYIGTGVVALLRWPGSRIGPMMALVGFLWLVQDLYWIWSPVPYAIAATYEKLYQAALAHLALIFPTGRIAGRLERRTIIAIWVWALTNNIVRMLFFDPNTVGCYGCRNLLLIDPDPTIGPAVNHATTYVSAFMITMAASVVVWHWRRATRAARHVMAPALWMVGPAVVYLLGVQLTDVTTLDPGTHHIIVDLLPAGLAVLPVGFLIGLLRTRLAYAHVGALLPELSGPVAPGRVRAALAATLRDPDLELLYWSPSSDGYVDADGHPHEPVAQPGRALSHIDGGSGPLAVMIVDEVALQEPTLLKAAAAVARLALENERLQAEVRSQLVQLRSTAARLVEAGQHARQRIERDLHDGAQQRLLALSMTLGQARTRARLSGDGEMSAFLDRAADDLQHAINELRELARGIHPMLLTQEGLASALYALAERAPLPVQVTAPRQRFPETVESTAYFFVSEALTNAARHSDASAVWVEVTLDAEELTIRVRDDGVGGVDDTASSTGTGLIGMRDRVVGGGGRMTVSSPAGAGTTLVARLPCA